jgi:hypothetical protein
VNIKYYIPPASPHVTDAVLGKVSVSLNLPDFSYKMQRHSLNLLILAIRRNTTRSVFIYRPRKEDQWIVEMRDPNGSHFSRLLPSL